MSESKKVEVTNLSFHLILNFATAHFAHFALTLESLYFHHIHFHTHYPLFTSKSTLVRLVPTILQVIFYHTFYSFLSFAKIASKSTMLAVNILDSKDSFVFPPLQEKSITIKTAKCKICYIGLAKNSFITTV